MTTLWILAALSAGVTMGFVLFAALSVSREEQERESRATLPKSLHPLGWDSRF